MNFLSTFSLDETNTQNSSLMSDHLKKNIITNHKSTTEEIAMAKLLDESQMYLDICANDAASYFAHDTPTSSAAESLQIQRRT